MTDPMMTTRFAHLDLPTASQLQGKLEIFQAYLAQNDHVDVPEGALFWQQLEAVWTGSNYVAEQMLQSPQEILARLLDGQLDQPCQKEDYRRALCVCLENTSDLNQLSKALRDFRRQEMVRIIWRDLANLAPVLEITAELSALADVCVDESLRLIYGWEVARMGTPIGR
ncbi:MAG: hypothetical protein KUG83_09115, partial [Gammaproteobacteria bacterium]|nr:hypothetical protein [Gammaproteobacteria bacterium]